MRKTLVIGDSCKDVHVYGICKRLAPDSPVPVFVPTEEKHNRGMAANVYENLIALGIKADLKTNKLFVEKKRFVERYTNHMFIRVDSGEERIKRIPKLSKELLEPYDLVVISDYNKGFLTEADIQFICENHPLVFIDTKKRIGKFCKDCAFLKINKDEYAASQDFLDGPDWDKKKLVVTLSGQGCLFNGKIYPVEKVEIKDLCGAGDTFLAAIAAKYLETRSMEQSIVYANKCATQVVQQKGVNTVKVT
jgi:bifunctional ADP-heptose synthase (sugar kinase/adenylyltransferase)